MAPKITASGAVHAGHPGVKAANIPTNAEPFDFAEFIIFILFILNAIIAILIPPNTEIIPVKAIDDTMYMPYCSDTISIWPGSIAIVKKKYNTPSIVQEIAAIAAYFLIVNTLETSCNLLTTYLLSVSAILIIFQMITVITIIVPTFH